MGGFFGFDDTPAAPARADSPREARAPPQASEGQEGGQGPGGRASGRSSGGGVREGRAGRAARGPGQELADLAAQVARAGAVQGPDTGEAAPAVSPQQFVIDRWNRYSDTVNAARLGLPAGSILRARAWGDTGVEVGFGFRLARSSCPWRTLSPRTASRGGGVSTRKAPAPRDRSSSGVRSSARIRPRRGVPPAALPTPCTPTTRGTFAGSFGRTPDSP